MGLDIMELVMAVEEHFGVTIPDERAEHIYTVGDLYRFLLARKGQRVPALCPTGQAFYRLRRTLTQEFGVERARVRPAARLRDLFPRETRAAAWPRLAASLGLANLPDPDPPRKRRPSLKVLGIAAAVATVVAGLLYPVMLFVPDKNPMAPAVVCLIAWVGLLLLVCEFYGMIWLGRWLERRIIPCVRDLVVRLVAYPPDPGAADPAKAAVWADLTAILSRQTGVPANEIRPEQTFNDLH
jgi:hypothetical protein